jgi:DNA-binding SARP family transcriptional activator
MTPFNRTFTRLHMSLDFHILGSLRILDEGREVTLGGHKQRALLVLLLLHANETLTTDRLIDELWGECPPASAAEAVQVHISRLRKALATGHGSDGNCHIVTRACGYELQADPERLDVLRFERLVAEGRRELAAGHPQLAAVALEQALSLWRGAPLGDLAYEPFAQAEIARLEGLRAGALEELVEAKLNLGRHGEVVAQLETLIAKHPYRERARGQLMLALYRSDRQADALQAYQATRRMLVEDLGIEPGERLRELEAAILAQDPVLAVPVPETVGPQRVVSVASERRQVSALLADMQASMQLGADFELLRAFTHHLFASLRDAGLCLEGIPDRSTGVARWKTCPSATSTATHQRPRSAAWIHTGAESTTTATFHRPADPCSAPA